MILRRAPHASFRAGVAIAVMWLLAAGGALSPAQDVRPEYLMLSDPGFDFPLGKIQLPEGAVGLWREMLQQPEPDLVKAAADSIAIAQLDNLAGLAECVPDLQQALANSELQGDAAYSIAHALVVLNAEAAADVLFAISKSRGSDFRQLIEPILAEWGHAAIRDVWRSRLSNPDAQRRELLLACAGTARVHDADSLPLLLEIVHARRRPSDVRFAAARAGGNLADTGLEQDAEELTGAASRELVDDLCAVSLIRHHVSARAQKLFLQMAVHENPTVAEPALRALLEIDPSLVLPLADDALRNADPKVRQCGLDAYIALPTVERLPKIADVLEDPHPDVRSSARRALHRFHDVPMFTQPVLDAGMNILSRPGWRGQEQSALLLAALGHQPAAPRLVELLESDRTEVMITAAWALRVLAVAETKDAVLDRATRVTQEVLSKPSSDWQPGSDEQLAHLCEALAVLGDARGVPLMRRHVPKDVYREKSRSAAVWGLGKLLEDQPDDDLAATLFSRLIDTDSTPPELDLVRRMSAITIGRMNAVSQRDFLQYYLGPVVYPGDVNYAVAWAIGRMGGKVPPKGQPIDPIRRGWPIEPVPPRIDP